MISHLKEGAPGWDGIVAKNLKCILSDSIAYPLSRVAKLSFQQVIFPRELKTDVITPFYKAKDPMMFNNHRAISLIYVFAKILKSLMHNRLLKFVNKKQIFNKHQFGFHDKHSTSMAPIILMKILLMLRTMANVLWVYSWISKQLLILLITVFYWTNYIFMICEVWHLIGFPVIYMIANN